MGTMSVRNDVLRNFKDYFNDSTVHGFKYVVQGRNRYEKVFWAILIVTGFAMSGEIIYKSLSGWDETPLQTTIEKVDAPVQDYPFPAVTICDSGQLQMPRRNRWMFPEHLLNWIDISKLERNGTPSTTTNKAEKDFQLNLIRWELGNILEQNMFVPFRKTCFSSRYKNYCGRILEFLILDGKEKLDNNIEHMYEQILNRWNTSYPNRKCSGNRDVMKKDLVQVYDEFFREKHEILRSNLTDSELDAVLNVSLSKGKSCTSTRNCNESMKSLMSLWRRLQNGIKLGSVCNLGNLVSNYNFLLKDSKQLHFAIHNLFAKMYPNLFVDKLAFTDFIALLGYDRETDFTTVFDLFYKANNEYKEIMKTLFPLHSFSGTSGQYNGIGEQNNSRKACYLQPLYNEWINYLYARKSLSTPKSRGKFIHIRNNQWIYR